MNKIEDIKSSNNGEHELNMQSKSQLSLKTFFYSWTLSDISKCLDFSGAAVYSPEFDFGGASWRLALIIDSNDNNLNEIKIRLCKTEKGETSYFLKYKISLFAENGSFAIQEAQSKFERDNILSHWLVFKRTDNMDILDAALKSDEIIIHCQCLVLTTVTCGDSADISITPTNNKVASMKKVKQKTSKLTPSNLKRIVVKRSSETRSEKQDTHFFLVLLLFCIVMLMSISPKQSLYNQNQSKEIKDLVISSTLKIINIADALNLTEVKIKSVDLLRSFYYEDYNISDLEVLNSSFSELNVIKGQVLTKQFQTEAEKPIQHE